MNDRMFGCILIAFAVVITASISGCINQSQPERNVTTYQKDGVEYTFSNNIYDAAKIPVYGSEQIFSMLSFASNIAIIYNGSIPEENSQIVVTAYNVVNKLQTYYLYSQNRFANFTAVDINDENSTIEGNSLIMFLKTNGTGANETSVSLEPMSAIVLNDTVISQRILSVIVVQGTGYKNLTLATDRLVLLTLGFPSNANFGRKECPPVWQCAEGSCDNSSGSWVQNMTCIDVACNNPPTVEFRQCQPAL